MTIESFLTKLLEHCGVDSTDVKTEIVDTDDRIEVGLWLPESESGVVIGFHGEVLDSIQRVLRILFSPDYEGKKIILDVNGYRQQRVEKLEQMTVSAARKVLETGRPFTFHSFLPSYERFVVHSALSDNEEFEGLESVSDGEGRMRRLTIGLKQS
jgi:spoIIIJ-associated protein